jgi:hypothetical protein
LRTKTREQIIVMAEQQGKVPQQNPQPLCFEDFARNRLSAIDYFAISP